MTKQKSRYAYRQDRNGVNVIVDTKTNRDLARVICWDSDTSQTDSMRRFVDALNECIPTSKRRIHP